MRKARHGSTVNRKVLALIWFVAASALIALQWRYHSGATGEASECNSTELAAAAESGREAAAKVALTTRQGSMAREKALLELRVREYEIRRAGFPTAADSFARAAEIRLKSDKVI